MTFRRAAALIVSTYLVMSPRGGAAQTPQGPDPTAAPQQNTQSAAQRHLTEAERLLNSIRTPDSLKKDDKKKFDQLRDNFSKLVSGFRANPDGFVPTSVVQKADVKPGKDAAPVNWKMNFSNFENDLANILGGGSSLPPSTPAGAAYTVGGAAAPVVTTTATGTTVVSGSAPVGTTGTVSIPGDAPAAPTATTGTNSVVADLAAPVTTTSGTGPVASTQGTTTQGIQSGGVIAVVGDIGIKDLDPEVRRQLEQVRLEAELFFAASTMNLESDSAR